MASMIIVVVNLCALRILLLEIFDRMFHTIGAMASIYPLTWLLAVLSFVTYYLLFLRPKMMGDSPSELK